MNAIDAGATSCEILLDTHKFSICDDGHGFQSRQEIEDFFSKCSAPLTRRGMQPMVDFGWAEAR